MSRAWASGLARKLLLSIPNLFFFFLRLHDVDKKKLELKKPTKVGWKNDVKTVVYISEEKFKISCRSIENSNKSKQFQLELTSQITTSNVHLKTKSVNIYSILQHQFRCYYIRENYPTTSDPLLSRKTNTSQQICLKSYLETD